MTRRDRFSRLRRLFKYSIVRGEILPPDARVDPETFPEDEFPISCPDCDYLLRGLPQQRCPECGRSFERGRLLVEQYVIQKSRRQSKYARRRNAWIERAGWLLFLSPVVLVAVVGQFMPAPAPASRKILGVLYLAAFAIGFLLIAAANVASSWPCNVDKKKRRRVYEAIDRTTPSFRTPREVQRAFRILIIVSASVVIGLMCWALWVE